MRRQKRSPFMAQCAWNAIRKDLQYRHLIGRRTLRQAWRNGFSGMFYYKLHEAGIPTPSGALPQRLHKAFTE